MEIWQRDYPRMNYPGGAERQRLDGLTMVKLTNKLLLIKENIHLVRRYGAAKLHLIFSISPHWLARLDLTLIFTFRTFLLLVYMHHVPVWLMIHHDKAAENEVW